MFTPNRNAHQNKLGTFLQEGIDGCAKILATGDHRRQKLMVIVSDGQPNKCGTAGYLTLITGPCCFSIGWTAQ